MKRLVFICLSLIFILLNHTYVVEAASKSTQIYTQMVVSASQLNVRSGPDAKASKLKTISKGTQLKAVALLDGWVKVELTPGSFGWVSGDYVYTKGTDSNKRVITNEQFMIGTQTKVRSGAGDNFPVLTTLEKDSIANYVNTSGNWVTIRLSDGRQGFIPKSAGNQVKMFLSTWEETSGVPIIIKPVTVTPPSAPPAQSNPATPSSVGKSVLSIDGNSSDGVIRKIDAVRKSSEFALSITTGVPVSFSSRQDGSQILITIRDAQGIDDGNYDLKSGGLDTLQVARDGRDTILTIFASADSSFTIQNIPSQNQFVIKIPMSTDLSLPATSNLLSGKTIILDAGHGGTQSSSSDPGATGGTGLKERDVVLDITKKTKDILQLQGANVIMTRESITTPLSLNGRAKLANDNNADVFVAIHANASTSPTLSGTSTYFYAPADKPLGTQREVRKTLAQTVQQALVQMLQRRNIGVLEANFQVLRDTTVPSILVETAFVSNAEEEALLADEDFRTKVAQGIANGLINFLTR